MDQQIALGSAVVGSDGRPVGKVTRVVLSPDDRELLEIIVRAGHLLHADRIVEIFQIERVEDGVVHLALRADEVSRLPRLIYHEYVVPAPRESRTGPYPISGSVAGGLTTPGVWGSNYSGEGFHTVNRSFFESAPFDSAAVELRSNLPADSVALGRGADILDRDGHAVGVLHEVVYDEHGDIVRIIAVARIFRHDRIEIPVDAIEAITDGRITLRVAAAEFALAPV